ncbi:MAG: T9SS type A sorting domain-containing protein [Ignavibacteriae bacterium]|nr:T9SS type A sorting domain-containing protein [Ignavibacteriota bacterium]MCB0723364.1 T9SS type A sorting domain-containing protein [Ignavibacteriota bacterium]MCB9243210.1 T9SS type A sorting domain-containing protein [Ignavibacteriales bacterium]
MKRLLLGLIVIVSMFSAEKVTNAQSFSFERVGPELEMIPYIKDSLQTVIRSAIVRNNTSNTIHMRFYRVQNNIPASWQTQMCYDLCYAYFVDTIAPPPLPPYDLGPNQVDTMFYIDFSGEEEGVGTGVVRMYNTDNPSEFVEQTFKLQIGDGVGIHQISSNVEEFRLDQNYPNPFNPSTKIRFSIPKNDFVNLKVYDILGNEVADLVDNQQLNTGAYEYEFNTATLNLSSGVYYYKLTTSQFTQVRKMMLVK